MQSVSSLMQSVKQDVSVDSQPSIHWSRLASHLSVQISLRLSTLNKNPVIINFEHRKDPVGNIITLLILTDTPQMGHNRPAGT